MFEAVAKLNIESFSKKARTSLKATMGQSQVIEDKRKRENEKKLEKKKVEEEEEENDERKWNPLKK